MRSTYRVDSANDPALLHTALDAAGIPVITVRSMGVSRDELSLLSVIVFPEGYDPQESSQAARIQAVISAHLGSEAVKGRAARPAPPSFSREAAFKNLEGV